MPHRLREVQLNFDLPWELLPGAVAVLDVETSGRSHKTARVIELTILRIQSDGRAFLLDTLLDPGGGVGPTSVHGIRARDVRGAPRFSQALGAFQASVDGALVVAHNASFDRNFIQTEIARCGGDWQPDTLCTLQLSRRVHPTRKGPGAHKLEGLLPLYGVHNFAPHRALGDVLATAQFFAAMTATGDPFLPVLISGLIKRAPGTSRWPTPAGAAPLKPRSSLEVMLGLEPPPEPVRGGRYRGDASPAPPPAPAPRRPEPRAPSPPSANEAAPSPRDWAALAGRDLSGQDLSGASLRWADLRGARLQEAELVGANLSQAKLGGADLRGARLVIAELREADFTSADLTGADLSGAEGAWCRLERTRLAGATACQAKLPEAKLGGADLTGADLTGAELTGADLTGADLSGAVLAGADLSRALLSGAKLVGARLVGARLRGATMDRADLSGADLRGASLRGASLTEAMLRDADATGADLSGCDLYGADLNGMILEDASLDGAELEGAAGLDSDP